jgi:hypothetical protein
MIKQYYVLFDSQDREVNFYDLSFPKALESIVHSARQVENSYIVHRKKDDSNKEVRDSIIWNYEQDFSRSISELNLAK